MKLSSALTVALAVAVTGACSDAPTDLLQVDAHSLNRGNGKGGGGGATSRVPLHVAWADLAVDATGARGDGIEGDGFHFAGGALVPSTVGVSTYADGECGVGAFTDTGSDSNGWFDVQPTLYKTSDPPPTCLRNLVIRRDGIAYSSDVEVHIWNLTSITASEDRRVGMGLQTETVAAGLGCALLIYDNDEWGGSTSATITLESESPRSWTVSGGIAACVTISKRGGRHELNTAVGDSGYFALPFSFTVAER